MKLAVVLASYNRRDLAAEAVRSVIAQHTPADLTLRTILVDDGSTDGTVQALIARFHLTPSDGSIHENESLTVITSENRERGAARNAGAQYARQWGADILVFLDSDDIWAPGSAQAIQARWNQAPPETVAVYCNSRLWDGADNLSEPKLPAHAPEGDLSTIYFSHSLFSIGTVAVRTDVFFRLNGFPEDRELSGSEDWVFYARLACAGPVVHCPHVTLHYRRHEGNTNSERFQHSIMLSREVLVPDLKLHFGPKAPSIERAMWRHAHLSIAGAFNSDGRCARAAQWLFTHWRNDPGVMRESRFWRVALSLGKRSVYGLLAR